MTVPDRCAPNDLLDLARLALTTGLDEVHLVFEGLDAEFPAPIGWQLSMTRVDSLHLVARESSGHANEFEALTQTPNHLRVTAQIGHPAQAFRGLGEPYWGADDITQWIRLPRPGIADLTGAEHTAHDADADLLIGAWKRGWSAERWLRRGSQTESAHHMHATTVPMGISYRFAGLNHFFNVDGHPGHRGNGTEVSVDVLLSRAGIGGAWTYSAIGLERLPVEDALARVHQPPPWHAEVAYFDDDLDEWVI